MNFLAKLGLITLLIAPLPALAGSAYDWQSGNSYNWSTYGGTTQVYGYNTNTGFVWNNTIQSNGNQSGTDASGNYWNYNASTGSYWNSNGHGCIGSGYARNCY